MGQYEWWEMAQWRKIIIRRAKLTKFLLFKGLPGWLGTDSSATKIFKVLDIPEPGHLSAD